MKLLPSLILVLCAIVTGHAQTSAKESIDAFEAYMGQDINYPAHARAHKIQGAVDVEFHLDPNGKVIDFKVTKDIGSTCAKEVKRVITMMPKNLRKSLTTSTSSGYFALEVLFGLNEDFRRGDTPSFSSDALKLPPFYVTAHTIR
jgi:hypothetical protein